MTETDPLACYRARLELLNKELCRLSEESVDIVELDKGGAGTVQFQVRSHCLRLRPTTVRPIVWLQDGPCADGAIFEFCGSDVHLHIVELKSQVKPKDWEAAKAQFRGMLICASAMLGILGIPGFSSVKLYIAYKLDRISPSASQSALPIAIKASATRDLAIGDWLKDEVSLPPWGKAPLVKIVRDGSGNAAHAL